LDFRLFSFAAFAALATRRKFFLSGPLVLSDPSYNFPVIRES
jgi:hypothetical protein